MMCAANDSPDNLMDTIRTFLSDFLESWNFQSSVEAQHLTKLTFWIWFRPLPKQNNHFCRNCSIYQEVENKRKCTLCERKWEILCCAINFQKYNNFCVTAFSGTPFSTDASMLKFDDTNAIPYCRYAGMKEDPGDKPGNMAATCERFEPVVTDVGRSIPKLHCKPSNRYEVVFFVAFNY